VSDTILFLNSEQQYKNLLNVQKKEVKSINNERSDKIIFSIYLYSN